MGEKSGFIGSVLKYWYVLLAGGGIAVVIALIEHRTGVPIPFGAYVGVAVLALLAACFLAWREENRGRLAAISTLNEKLPHLRIRPREITTEESTMRTAIRLSIDVVNQGADSSVTHWGLRLWASAIPVEGVEIQSLIRKGETVPAVVRTSVSGRYAKEIHSGAVFFVSIQDHLEFGYTAAIASTGQGRPAKIMKQKKGS